MPADRRRLRSGSRDLVEALDHLRDFVQVARSFTFVFIMA
jgi:hypothetical protein